MTGSGRRRHEVPRLLLAVVVLALIGCVAAAVAFARGWSSGDSVVAGTASGPGPTTTRTMPAPGSVDPGTGSSTVVPAAPQPLPRSVPVELQIPAIGVRTSLVQLGLARDGTLQVPTNFAVAGWYTLGPAPGELGPAVIAGHIDSYRGPAVFFRLARLGTGDEVRVTSQDGMVGVFRVYEVGRYPKTSFPTDRVYGDTATPELRLITCGGAFDQKARSYRDNVVVYARLTATQPHP